MNLQPDSLYDLVVMDGVGAALRAIKSDGEANYSDCTVSLVYALAKDQNNSGRLSHSRGSSDSEDGADFSRCIEAAFIRSVNSGNDSDDLESRALAVLEIDEHAVFANRYLGHQRLRRKNYQAAITHFDNVLFSYPKEAGTILDRAAALTLDKRYSEALNSAKDGRSSLRKLIYMFMIRSHTLIGRIIFGLVLAIPILLFRSPWLAFVALSLLFIGMLFFSIRSGDELILGTAAAWQAEIVVFLIARLGIGVLIDLVI